MFFPRKDEIKICYNHPHYKVPLVWTFKFRGCEYWCPYCGFMGGMFGSGEDVKETKTLLERLEIYKKAAHTFLSTDSGEWKYGVKASKLNSVLNDAVSDTTEAK